MTEIKVNEIMANYTTEQQNVIEMDMLFSHMFGMPAPKTNDEFKAYCDKIVEKIEQEKLAKEKAKKTRIENDTKKAKDLGMTYEQYVEYHKAILKRQRDIKKVKELQKELKKIQRKIDQYNKGIQEIDNKYEGLIK